MADHLWTLIAAHPFAWWVLVFSAVVGMALGINQHARELAEDVRLAMKRADHSVDFTARSAVMPPPKLSDQLRAVATLTALWRFFAAPELVASEWEVEFLDLRAKRRGLTLVRSDVGALLTRLDEALIGKRPILKAELVRSEEQAS